MRRPFLRTRFLVALALGGSGAAPLPGQPAPAAVPEARSKKEGKRREIVWNNADGRTRPHISHHVLASPAMGRDVGLIAPRQVLAVNGRKDTLFANSEIDRGAAQVRKIFAAAGTPENFQHRWGAEGHRFYKDLMWPFVHAALGRP